MAAMAHGFRFSSKKAAAFLTFRATAVTSKSLARYTTKSNNIKNKRSATTVARATQLPRPDIRKLAQLSKVKLTEEQIRDFQPKVDKVVDWFAQLQEVELDEAEIQDFEVIDSAGKQGLREDVPDAKEEVFERDVIFDQVPEMQGDYFKLPRTSTENDT